MSDVVRVCAITGQDECTDCTAGTCDGLRYRAFWMRRRIEAPASQEAA